MSSTAKPGKGKPFQQGQYRKGSYQLTLGADGSIRVKPGDWISKYCACLYGDPIVGWEEFGRLRQGKIMRLADPSQIHAGETIYHLPTYAAKHGSVQVKEISSNVWFGVGVNYGGHFFLIGTNAAHGWMYSLDDYNRNFLFSSESWRIGPGLGGSWGVSLIVITSLRDPKEMNSYVNSDVDFQIGLGTRWGEAAKSARHLKTVNRLATTIEKSKTLQRVSQKAPIKQALRLSPDDWNKLRKRFLDLMQGADFKFDSPLPCLYSIGIPVPYSSLELSGYWQFSNYRLERVSGA